MGAQTQKKERGPKGGGPRGEGAQTQKKVGAQRVGGPKGWEAKNFALFFLLPPQFSLFFSLSKGLLVEFGRGLGPWTSQIVRLGSLGSLREDHHGEDSRFLKLSGKSVRDTCDLNTPVNFVVLIGTLGSLMGGRQLWCTLAQSSQT